MMDNFQFEGDLTSLSERQLKFVSSVLRDRGFNNGKVLVSTIGKMGYASTIKRITIEQNGETFNMVAKVAFSNEVVRAQLTQKALFHNEHIMYTEVLVKFTELEKKVGVSENERLRYAACYGSLTEEPNEILLFEDLHESNFLMMESQSLTDDCVKLFIKNLASLHSLSHALKILEPETYDTYKRRLVNLRENIKNIERIKSFFDELEISVVAILAMCEDENNKTQVRRCLSDFYNNISENRKIDKVSQYSVIQQGDAFTHNVLFRMEGAKAVQCCMIDYQLSNHNTPVDDLQVMIFNCTDYETRAKHYHDWIDYYHSQLDRCLAYFGLKASYIYPRYQLDADLKRYSELSFAISLMYANVLMNVSEEAAKVKEVVDNDNEMVQLIEMTKFSNLSESTLARIKTRIEELIKSFKELGYISR